MQLQADLKGLGYDLTVSRSDKAGEVAITSKEFDDTDHRVRFLAFMRGKSSPRFGVCYAGFNKLRLKSSSIPFVGFDDSYSLECFN